jgi:hypothetical protein
LSGRLASKSPPIELLQYQQPAYLGWIKTIKSETPIEKSTFSTASVKTGGPDAAA